MELSSNKTETTAVVNAEAGLGGSKGPSPPEMPKSAGARAPRRHKRRDVHLGDRLFSWTLGLLAFAVVVLLTLIGLFLFRGAAPALAHSGWGFFASTDWNPVAESYGALTSIFGTVVSSAIAILVATPLSIGVALFLTEIAPKRLGRVVGFLVEMLAAIPSVVYGLWGIFVLAPWVKNSVTPALKGSLGFLPLFQGPSYGVGMLSAGFILAIMIIPTISSITRQVFKAIPQVQREAALGMGATRWEMMKLAVLRNSRAGIFGASVLGLGRALGETMAVTMVIGNRPQIAASLFAPAQSMASIIANEYAEATSDIHLSTLLAIGFSLFVLTFIINGAARLIIRGSVGRL